MKIKVKLIELNLKTMVEKEEKTSECEKY